MVNILSLLCTFSRLLQIPCHEVVGVYCTALHLFAHGVSTPLRARMIMGLPPERRVQDTGGGHFPIDPLALGSAIRTDSSSSRDTTVRIAPGHFEPFDYRWLNCGIGIIPRPPPHSLQRRIMGKRSGSTKAAMARTSD